MSGTTIDPNTPLLVTLPARSWNALLSCAGEGLGALSAVIADVQRQCMQQSTTPRQEAEYMPANPSGNPHRQNGDGRLNEQP